MHRPRTKRQSRYVPVCSSGVVVFSNRHATVRGSARPKLSPCICVNTATANPDHHYPGERHMAHHAHLLSTQSGVHCTALQSVSSPCRGHTQAAAARLSRVADRTLARFSRRTSPIVTEAGSPGRIDRAGETIWDTCRSAGR